MSPAGSGRISLGSVAAAGAHEPLRSALPHDESQLDAVYCAQPPSVAQIRHDVIAAATCCGAPESTLPQIRLAVSEAATNVVLHAYRDRPCAGDVHVRVGRVEQFLDVSIRDSGVGMSVRTDSPGAGLGLSLMAHATSRCLITSSCGLGTDVLLRFALDR